MASVFPINKNRHADYSVLDSKIYSHLKDQHMLPITIHEFIHLSAEFPLAFVKNSESGRFQAIAILGFTPGENLFFYENRWQGLRVPRMADIHPFILMPDMFTPNQLVLGINESSELIVNNGNKLFDVNGHETSYLVEKKQTLAEYFEDDSKTQLIIDILLKNKLIKDQVIKVNCNDQELTINGIYTIDADRLNSLPELEFIDLRNRGLLPVLYAQMASMQHLEDLIKLKIDSESQSRG